MKPRAKGKLRRARHLVFGGHGSRCRREEDGKCRTRSDIAWNPAADDLLCVSESALLRCQGRHPMFPPSQLPEIGVSLSQVTQNRGRFTNVRTSLQQTLSTRFRARLTKERHAHRNPKHPDNPHPEDTAIRKEIGRDAARDPVLSGCTHRNWGALLLEAGLGVWERSSQHDTSTLRCRHQSNVPVYLPGTQSLAHYAWRMSCQRVVKLCLAWRLRMLGAFCDGRTDPFVAPLCLLCDCG